MLDRAKTKHRVVVESSLKGYRSEHRQPNMQCPVSGRHLPVVDACRNGECCIARIDVQMMSAQGSSFAYENLREGLIDQAILGGHIEDNTTGILQPALAIGWELKSPLRWVFKLQDGMVFANGDSFDAAAVAPAGLLLWQRVTFDAVGADVAAFVARADSVELQLLAVKSP